MPTYIGAQLLGAFAGAVVVSTSPTRPHWAVTTDQSAKLGVFCTAPEIPRRRGANFVTEVVGTAVLVFGVLAIAANASELAGEIDLSAVFATGINPLLVGFLVWGIGLSLGGPTGYAINPARDLGPRIAPRGPADPRQGRFGLGLRLGAGAGTAGPAASSARWPSRLSAGRRSRT